MAKRIIHLICKVGEKINADPDTKDILQLFFLPDYNVSLAEIIIPGEGWGGAGMPPGGD
jgi:starch phosphorylase